MPKRRSRLRTVLLSALAVVVLGLGAIHLFYPLPYVYTVMVWRDADFSDIDHFPASVIAAPDSSSDLPVVPDPHVAEIIEQHPDIDNFDGFLEQTETSAFLVVHDGKLVEERYLLGHDGESFQNTFSVSKSITSALVGLALRDGVLELEAPVTRYLPELGDRDVRFSKITVSDLLDMRSGIRYSDEIRFPFVNSDNPLIYYHPDLESVILERTTIASPPGTFQYNNYNPPMLGVILRRVTDTQVSEYMESQIWEPMGAVGSAGWTIDDNKLERMESGFHARARDLARFGLLYLNGGEVSGRHVIPELWIQETTDLPEPTELDTYDGRRWGYRLGWWIVPRPSGRSDFCAIGRYGQFIYVSPQYDIVIVRNGPGRGDWGDRDWTELFYFMVERL